MAADFIWPFHLGLRVAKTLVASRMGRRLAWPESFLWRDDFFIALRILELCNMCSFSVSASRVDSLFWSIIVGKTNQLGRQEFNGEPNSERQRVGQ